MCIYIILYICLFVLYMYVIHCHYSECMSASPCEIDCEHYHVSDDEFSFVEEVFHLAPWVVFFTPSPPPPPPPPPPLPPLPPPAPKWRNKTKLCFCGSKPEAVKDISISYWTLFKGRGGRLGSGHPQKTIQGPNRLYKAQKHYTKPQKH